MTNAVIYFRPRQCRFSPCGCNALPRSESHTIFIPRNGTSLTVDNQADGVGFIFGTEKTDIFFFIVCSPVEPIDTIIAAARTPAEAEKAINDFLRYSEILFDRCRRFCFDLDFRFRLLCRSFHRCRGKRFRHRFIQIVIVLDERFNQLPRRLPRE